MIIDNKTSKNLCICGGNSKHGEPDFSISIEANKREEIKIEISDYFDRLVINELNIP